MTAVLLPNGKQQYFAANGDPANGYKLYTTNTGTAINRTTWQDQGQTTPNANPIVLDARGEAVIFWSGAYRVRLEDPLGNTIWTVDGVSDLAYGAGLRADLAATGDGAKGAGLVSFDATLTYTAGSVGSFLTSIYGRTAGEIAAAIVPVNYFYPPGHVYRYATNTAPGTTDMTTAFQNAALSSLNPYAPNDTYKITGSIPLRDFQRWTLNGARIVITGTTLEVFTASVGIDDWAILGDWSVTGDNATNGATAGSAAAVRITDSMRWRVEGLTAIQIKGWGIRVRPGGSVSNRGEKGQVEGFQSFGNYIGFECEAGTGAEYINVIGPVITRCNTGMNVAAGNLNVTGGSIVDNTTGVNLVNGTNHGHGIFCGVQINHNTTQVKANTVTNGQTFEGCHFFQGIIHLDHSTGVNFHGGIMDVDEYRFEESDGCGFFNCLMTDTYANTINNDYNASHSYTVWRGCHTKLGEPWRGATGNIKGLRATATMAASQVFSAANVNATSDIKLDTKAVASANQASQTTVAYLACYDVTTGIFTAKKGGDGKIRVNCQLVISNNAADAGKFQVFATHSTLGDYYFDLLPLAPAAAATSWVAILAAELPISLAETLKFRITGSGVANNVTVTNSGGTKAQVEGL